LTLYVSRARSKRDLPISTAYFVRGSRILWAFFSGSTAYFVRGSNYCVRGSKISAEAKSNRKIQLFPLESAAWISLNNESVFLGDTSLSFGNW
jgi:hypothetical protein